MPVTIGPFANVPAPGDPITSPWAQQLTQHSVDNRTRLAKSVTVVGSGGSSGGAFGLVSYTFPAQTVAGILMCWYHGRLDFNGGTSYSVDLTLAGTAAARHVFETAELGAGRYRQFHLHGIVATVAGSGTTVGVGGAGAANVTAFADARSNRLDMLWIGTAPA